MPAELHLGSGEHPLCAAILGWPENLPCIRKAVLSRSASASPAPDEMTELRQAGLIGPAGDWTDLGREVLDLLEHEVWQEGDEVHDTLRQRPEAIKGAILDVGCSTGWTLRHLGEAGRRVGVDIDRTALTLGYRLARSEQQDVEFRYASAHELPFPDQSFDCVICRNAITYTYQKQTLAEMTRVLKPNGVLFVRFENFRYDIQHVIHAGSPWAMACRLRDFAFGVIHAAVGWQTQSKARISPGRVFGSKIRLQSYLRRADCHVVQAVDSLRCPRIFGRANQTSMLACKS